MPKGFLEHANITVSDPERSSALLQKLCGWHERWLSYDTTQRTTRVSDSHGNVTEYEWNQQGQVTRLVQPDGSAASYEYVEGRLVGICTRTDILRARARQLADERAPTRVRTTT